MLSGTGPPLCGFYFGGIAVNIFVYSDESGVFDKLHNDLFVFGGAVFLSKEERDICGRKYIAAERVIREREHFDLVSEVKATTISNTNKGKLYRSINQIEKFGVVINEKKVLDSIFSVKKSKQRYLDFAYKISVKRKFEDLIKRGIIIPNQVEGIYFFVDEHTTATDGKYELREALEQEFRFGTYNWNYSVFFPPLFPNVKTVDVCFCNSSKVTLVRAADIIANKIYYYANEKRIYELRKDNFNIINLP